MKKEPLRRLGFASLAALGISTAAPLASAQQKTFHLDRLEVPGAPDDGLVLFHPKTDPGPIFYAQLAVGYSLRPLHTSTIVVDKPTLTSSSIGVVQHQMTTYANAGFEFLDRFTVGLSFPVTWWEAGGNPGYKSNTKTTAVDTSGPAVADTRLDLRAVIARTANKKGAVGGQISIFTPTGNGSSTNFGGDGQTTAMVMFSGEYSFRFLTVGANTGIHLRPKNSINDPVAGAGLGIADEWRWAVGAYVPIRAGKYRIGLNIFGQTGLESDTTVIGDTVFTKRNSPVEWNVEGRVKFGPKNRWWAGFAGGTQILQGYGAPDMRLVGLVGAALPLQDSDAASPDPRKVLHEKWRAQHTTLDSDHDGIPDDIDACPNEPEDHKGSDPNDGCPMPPDRDGDGILDAQDKCPDVAEDKDGIDDGDGCPEDDADSDGVPDAEDACPKEPGQKNTDATKNGCPSFIRLEGSTVRILQQVHFATGKSTILPDSFPMLQEIANLLKVNLQIKKMAIEGHTDNKGAADMNMKLSQGRSDSVMKWLTDHEVAASRLEAHGYGMTKPLEANDTDAGRAANRRVEFKILEEDDANKPTD